jgi:hypothetical protein
VSLAPHPSNLGLNGEGNSTTELESKSVVLSQGTLPHGGYSEFSIKNVGLFYLKITHEDRLVQQERIPSSIQESTILPGFNEVGSTLFYKRSVLLYLMTLNRRVNQATASLLHRL